MMSVNSRPRSKPGMCERPPLQENCCFANFEDTWNLSVFRSLNKREYILLDREMDKLDVPVNLLNDRATPVQYVQEQPI